MASRNTKTPENMEIVNVALDVVLGKAHRQREPENLPT
jgi:hypothetical protein